MARSGSVDWSKQARLALPLLIKMPSNKVAQTLGISERAFVGFLERNGVEVPIRKFVRGKIVADDLPLIYGLRKLKEPVESIAEKFDVCQSVIYRIISKPIKYWQQEKFPVLNTTSELKQMLKRVIEIEVTDDSKMVLVGMGIGTFEIRVKEEHVLVAKKLVQDKHYRWELRDEEEAAIIGDLLVMTGQIKREIRHADKKRASKLQSR